MSRITLSTCRQLYEEDGSLYLSLYRVDGVSNGDTFTFSSAFSAVRAAGGILSVAEAAVGSTLCSFTLTSVVGNSPPFVFQTSVTSPRTAYLFVVGSKA